jgi:peptidoglycan/LPS O-acetylase OafA/YrhL
MRAVAVIAVWINHLNHALLPGGFLGVDVFFVISGYVVTSSLLGRHEDDRAGFLRNFYQRRFRRLMPALIANVLLASILFSAFVSPLDDVRVPSLRTGLSALFGVSNLYLLKQGTNYFSINTQYNIFTHTWSLGVEEQYYLLWPLVLLLCGVGPSFVRHGLHRLMIVSCCLVSGSLLFFLFLSLTGRGDAAFFLMPARFWELGAGSLAFILRHKGLLAPFPPHPRRHQVMTWVVFAALAAIFFAPESQRIASTLAIVLITSLILILTESKDSLARCLGHPLPLGIGLRSYSLYLWHWPVIVLARWTWGLSAITVLPIIAVTLLLTFISYKLESFFRYSKPGNTIFSRPLLLYPALAFLVGGIVVLLQGPLRWALFAGARGGEATTTTNMKLIGGTPVNSNNCFKEPIAKLDKGNVYDRCATHSSTLASTLYFEGDSHTEVLIPLGEKIFQAGHYNVAFFARGGCPFPYFSPWVANWHSKPRYQLCQPHYEAQLSRLVPLLHQGDALVLVSNLEILTGMDATSQKAAEASYERQIERISNTLRPLGARLVIFAPIPSFKHRASVLIPMTACRSEWYRPAWSIGSDCKPSFTDRTAHLRSRQRVEALFAKLERRHENVHIFHPLDTICPASMERCSTHSGDNMLYSDGHHLSNYGAVMLYPAFNQFMHRLEKSSSG